MAQDAGAASCALFVEQAEATVADGTVTRHAARASRRVPGMRRAGNMAGPGPGLGKVSSMCSLIILSRLFHVASAKSKFGSSCLSSLATLLPDNYGFLPNAAKRFNSKS